MTSIVPTKRKIYAVSELTRLIKSAIEKKLGAVWVEGELSNVRQPSSGHMYFTIKDESSQISGVLFRGQQRGLTFRLKDGLLVRVFGEITVYERGGNYQIIVRKMEEGGKGTLQARFEEMKERLRKEGLFDEDRKKPIPLLPQHVGLITSPTGAAIRDILNVITRRFPNLHLVLAPVRVQGDEAPQEIARAVDFLNSYGGLDVLIVGRGGGSLEDLWCFNEETVARAISRSAIPVISAVGHEIDYTISDFVADLRVPTPSAAAELVVGRKDAFEERLDAMAESLARSLRECMLSAKSRLVAARGSYVFREPQNIAKQYFQRLDAIEMRMDHQMRGNIAKGEQRLADLGLRTTHVIGMKSQAYLQDVRRLDTHLKALNPVGVLRRGYCITRDEKGRVVRLAGALKVGSLLSTRFEKGTAESEVIGVDAGE